jgi:hypothetical protein
MMDGKVLEPSAYASAPSLLHVVGLVECVLAI